MSTHDGSLTLIFCASSIEEEEEEGREEDPPMGREAWAGASRACIQVVKPDEFLGKITVGYGDATWADEGGMR